MSGSKSITRQPFGPQDSTPVATYGDLWWGGTAQNGWGVTINQQYRTLFSLWYTYDRNGRPTWFVMELPPFANGELHLGHARNYAIADACARFRRMAGHDVLYTTGFDTFGLPNEIAQTGEPSAPLSFAMK